MLFRVRLGLSFGVRLVWLLRGLAVTCRRMLDRLRLRFGFAWPVVPDLGSADLIGSDRRWLGLSGCLRPGIRGLLGGRHRFRRLGLIGTHRLLGCVAHRGTRPLVTAVTRRGR